LEYYIDHLTLRRTILVLLVCIGVSMYRNNEFTVGSQPSLRSAESHNHLKTAFIPLLQNEDDDGIPNEAPDASNQATDEGDEPDMIDWILEETSFPPL